MKSKHRDAYQMALDKEFWERIRSGGRIDDDERQRLIAVLDANSHYDSVVIGSDAKPHRLWNGRTDRSGNGVFPFKGRNMSSNRAAVLIEVGSIPARFVCRRDDACPGNCIEVSHISAIDVAENGSRNGPIIHAERDEQGKSLLSSRIMTRLVNAARDESGKSLFSKRAGKAAHVDRDSDGKSLSAKRAGVMAHAAKDSDGKSMHGKRAAARMHAAKDADGKSVLAKRLHAAKDSDGKSLHAKRLSALRHRAKGITVT